MAESAITTLLSKFGELTTQEAKVLLQVGEDVVHLRNQLEWLQAFIRDADRDRRHRGGTDGVTRVWVQQTRQVAFDAEDVVDRFFLKVNQESRGYGSWKTMLAYLTDFWSQITVRHVLSGKIQRIRNNLDKLSENQKTFNMEHRPGIWTPSTTALAPRYDPTWPRPVGLDDGVAMNLWQLLEDKAGVQKMVVPLLGESGSGKSTMVDIQHNMFKLVYKSVSIIWYSMPPGSSTEDLLRQVYKRAHADDCPAVSGTDDIAARLYGLLSGKKYLVVLSGISSTTMLNCLWASMPDDENGSRMVLILEPDAQGDKVARRAAELNGKRAGDNQQQVNSILRLSRWNQRRSWELFCSRVAKDDYCNCEYEEMVYEITRGHPLAIVVLAGFLRHKDMAAEWKVLLEQLLKPPCASDPPEATDQTDASSKLPMTMGMTMNRILSASYDDLHQDLRSCFLYFAAYPKNIVHRADQIVQMWIAEGFIRPQRGRTLEELGHLYLEELVSRCLLQIEPRWCRDIQRVRIHSRVLEFLQSEARHASFIEVHDRNDVLAPASLRRLSVQDDGNGGYTTFAAARFPKLRSFICRVEEEEEKAAGQGGPTPTTASSSGWSKIISCLVGCLPTWGWGDGEGEQAGGPHLDFLRGSKLLRLLSVSGLNLRKLPSDIGHMVHLRYLRVDSRNLKKLPSSIRWLHNLQTLDIRNTQVKEVDPKFWTIKALRHVLAAELALPVSIAEDLHDLQTLHGVTTGQGGWQENNCPLHKMANLRSLELRGLENAKHGAALASALRCMRLLGHLELQGDVIRACVFTEPSLRGLQTMVLHEASVKWGDDIQLEGFDFHRARPNLAQVKLLKGEKNQEMPQEIKEQLKKAKVQLVEE